MTGDLIQSAWDGACVTVTLNRPSKANSLTPEMLQELRDIFRAVATDENVRAVIITGAGDRVFCAGADLSTLHDPVDGPDPWEEMAQALHALPVLTLAAVNGPCIGGGLTVALGCDIRISVPEARFAYPVLKNHVVPGQYDVDRLQALVGPGRAAAILLGGDTVGAADARAWGLVDRVVERGALTEICRNTCAVAMASDGAHLATLKSMLRRAGA